MQKGISLAIITAYSHALWLKLLRWCKHINNSNKIRAQVWENFIERKIYWEANTTPPIYLLEYCEANTVCV